MFQPKDAAAFKELNVAWITKYFSMEEHDYEMLDNPEGYIIRPGGQIMMAFVDGRAVGCCALIPVKAGVLELAKMAVAEESRGLGIGRKMLEETVAKAREMGAARLVLGTNSKLLDAVHLYESVGFRHLPPEPTPYVRADVFMEMEL
jgi:N-acetylglutamate synthase-like GNAT family acetyltransferase